MAPQVLLPLPNLLLLRLLVGAALDPAAAAVARRPPRHLPLPDELECVGEAAAEQVHRFHYLCGHRRQLRRPRPHSIHHVLSPAGDARVHEQDAEVGGDSEMRSCCPVEFEEAAERDDGVVDA